MGEKWGRINSVFFKLSVIVVVAFWILGISTQGHTSGVKRSNWVPNVGQREFRAEEQPVGGRWMFV